jgi:type II secretory pathway predicted ATPase ExeA
MTAFSDASHFGLRAEPFSKEIGDTDLWLPSSKGDVVEGLLAACEARASVVLTGDPGVGKTCVLRALRARLPEERFRLTYCHNATLGRRDFYRQLCRAMGLAPSATAAAVFYAVSTHVEELGRDRVHPVFALDEAHLLHQDIMDHLHILLNYNWDSRALLSLVLVGLPELRDRLALRRNRSLYSRIHHRFALDEASLADTGEYLAYRLRQPAPSATSSPSTPSQSSTSTPRARSVTSTASLPPPCGTPLGERRNSSTATPSSTSPPDRRDHQAPAIIQVAGAVAFGLMAIQPRTERALRDGHRVYTRGRTTMAIHQPGHDAISQRGREQQGLDAVRRGWSATLR